MILMTWLAAMPTPSPPTNTPATPADGGGTLAAYVALAVAILTPLAAMVKALASWRSRRQRKAETDGNFIKNESVISGMTLQSWQESRQEVKDARAEAKEARERAQAAETRADHADDRADQAETRLRKAEARIDELEAAFKAFQRRVAACSVADPPGCPLREAVVELPTP
ncbi:hypothetical protein LQ327_09080 [Actinomycetospora endophytica]|uniref:Uncharacterized protein n=1 Tax=Actinomycetospora endophytica TaxID=2291215 RepID=A0ABS8P7L4_9PSEU|nr:hypothetical protein [Actinomycetospora endophytica]MCD2193535.1 hypothetical protein [Actinomycetospora endophytica]